MLISFILSYLESVFVAFLLYFHFYLATARSARNGVSLDVLGVLQGVAGTQRLKISATRKLEQAFTVDCFNDSVLFVPLLAPAAS